MSDHFVRATRKSLAVVILGNALATYAVSAQVTAPSIDASQPVYVKRATLQQTMLDTRAAFGEIMATQAEARASVSLGPWYLADASVLENQFPGEFDLHAKTANGKPAWTQKADWTDGKPFDFPGSTAILARTVTCKNPVRILLGCGGGDRLDLFLDDQHVLGADTTITYARYGTSMHLDATRVDQVVFLVVLGAGEHQLVMKLDQQSPGPRQAFFSVAPNPVPFLWRQIEEDFPRSANHLLELIRFDWFRTDGWFARSDAQLERQFLDRMLADMGQRGETLRRKLLSLTSENVPATDHRWLDLCVTAAELRAASGDIDRLRKSVTHLADTYPGVYPGQAFVVRLEELKRRLLTQAENSLDPRDAATIDLVADLDAARHEMLVATNPLLKNRELLFIRRYTYDSQHFYDDYYHGVRKYGGDLCTLSIDDGSVEVILPQLSGGVFDRFDLSFDADRVVFGYRPPKPEGFRIWEAGIDGSHLRQLTFEPEDEADRMARYGLHGPSACQASPILHGHWTDDMHPCYLPNGQIVFASSRCERTAVCGGHTLPCTVLYRINPDGSRMERISQGMLSEFTPTVMADGRVLYTRWEYVYKGIAAIQPLWAVRPDGSGGEEIYGDNIRDPGVFYQARQVPGHPNLIVCNGCGHEPLSVGSILLLDLHKDKRAETVMTSLTPDTKVQELRGLYQRRNGKWQEDLYGPFYCDPYPLSDKYFLVSCNPSKRYNDESAYGLYLLDAFGNRVPIHDDPEMSCFQPVLLESRPKPLPMPATARPGAIANGQNQNPSNRSAQGDATVLLQDVHNGLAGVERGSVKYLRILRQIPRPWSVWPYAADDRWPGQMVAVSWYSHIWIAVLEGIVPVHEDGSALFTVPADCNLYFQALDEDFMEVQRMRTFINFRPGENRSCIGCHEHRTQPPSSDLRGTPVALGYPPAKTGPQPGDVAPRPLHYETDIQPIFDKHCTSCHGDSEPEGELALTGTLTSHFNRSYEQLMSKELVSTVTEWAPPPGNKSSWIWSMEHAPTIAPFSYGSHASRLIDVLRDGHYDVELSQPEFVKLVTWIDTNGQYYGSYFGYRHSRYRGRKDFRPNPTLESAYGIRPGLDRVDSQDPVPATIVAHWAFDEGQGEVAQDSSGAGHHGSVVGAQRVGGKLGGALQFSGNADYVRVGDIGGEFQTLSIALWLKTDSHRNRWNAILFCDDWSEQDLHLSVLDSGHVNVAIHNGSGGGYHRASDGIVGDGRWHHVGLVCDQRLGGSIQFYIDGEPDRRHPLYGLEMPVRLTGVRLGGYNVWENNPGHNFHGTLDDFRIYRGMLTEEALAELASPPGEAK
jgi:hypothetical protein